MSLCTCAHVYVLHKNIQVSSLMTLIAEILTEEDSRTFILQISDKKNSEMAIFCLMNFSMSY